MSHGVADSASSLPGSGCGLDRDLTLGRGAAMVWALVRVTEDSTAMLVAMKPMAKLHE